MPPQLPANPAAVLMSVINRILRRGENLKMDILAGTVSRNRRQAVKNTEEHREQHRLVFYVLQRHFPYPSELRIRTIARITKNIWTFKKANTDTFWVLCV